MKYFSDKLFIVCPDILSILFLFYAFFSVVFLQRYLVRCLQVSLLDKGKKFNDYKKWNYERKTINRAVPTAPLTIKLEISFEDLYCKYECIS